MTAFFTRGAELSTRLAKLAEDQLHHRKRSAKDQLFLKRLIDSEWKEVDHVCTRTKERTSWDGWYTELFWDPKMAFEFEPVVSDVHTTPADQAGSPIGVILHGATAPPTAMVLTIPGDDGESCAFVGPISQYRTVKTRDFDRLDDQRWKQMLNEGSAPGPEAWQRDFMPGAK
jgi:hypothetical protein